MCGAEDPRLASLGQGGGLTRALGSGSAASAGAEGEMQRCWRLLVSHLTDDTQPWLQRWGGNPKERSVREGRSARRWRPVDPARARLQASTTSKHHGDELEHPDPANSLR